jgi:hypothetical protein
MCGLHLLPWSERENSGSGGEGKTYNVLINVSLVSLVSRRRILRGFSGDPFKHTIRAALVLSGGTMSLWRSS